MNIGTAESSQYVPNTVIVPASTLYAYNNPRRYHEAAIFDASYVKLREVTLGYQIPPAFGDLKTDGTGRASLSKTWAELGVAAPKAGSSVSLTWTGEYKGQAFARLSRVQADN